ncbi:biotin-dependent carboxyltransferase family protein [Pseudonocardia spinosispora]|uniref:5-oxoprolinase subunit C family protein n=1 Tax=Pseudonocardia spinosispora TaxID=103441 RepID=UPI0004045C20|nr:biotin-dependent carboxyltransferase family protein [Pseudonocardia spinosispora]
MSASIRAVTVVRTGPLTVVTDLGRPGRAHIGVPRSGALDEPALRLANRLVGNPEACAALEVLLGGLELRAESACTVAVTGPPVLVTVTSESGARRRAGTHRALALAEGDRLTLGTAEHGLRCYVALSGGLDTEEVLGSRGTDLLSGLGPDPVSEGDRIVLGAVRGDPPADAEPVPVTVPPARLDVPVLLGPRDDWFTDPADALRARVWTVGSASNRIGLRLEGTGLARVADREGAELPSEPMLPGAVQVPPSGQPVIFLADGPTTGGYPVIAVVPRAALPGLAQARPGSQLRLHPR